MLLRNRIWLATFVIVLVAALTPAWSGFGHIRPLIAFEPHRVDWHRCVDVAGVSAHMAPSRVLAVLGRPPQRDEYSWTYDSVRVWFEPTDKIWKRVFSVEGTTLSQDGHAIAARGWTAAQVHTCCGARSGAITLADGSEAWIYNYGGIKAAVYFTTAQEVQRVSIEVPAEGDDPLSLTTPQL